MRVKQIYSASDPGDDLIGVSVSGASTYYSDPFTADSGRAVSIHVVWTSTPTGTFTLWYSNKPNPSLADDTDWVQDTTWSPTNPAGSASKAFYTIGNLTALRCRLKYVNSASSGTILAWACGAVQ
jgi:hypothetical protein